MAQTATEFALATLANQDNFESLEQEQHFAKNLAIAANMTAQQRAIQSTRGANGKTVAMFGVGNARATMKLTVKRKTMNILGTLQVPLFGLVHFLNDYVQAVSTASLDAEDPYTVTSIARTADRSGLAITYTSITGGRVDVVEIRQAGASYWALVNMLQANAFKLSSAVFQISNVLDKKILQTDLSYLDKSIFGKVNGQDTISVGGLAKKTDFNQTVSEIPIVMDVDAETILFIPMIKSTVTLTDFELSADFTIAYFNKVGKKFL